MLKLIIEDDEGRKTVVPFVRDEITVGRQEGNTIRLTERNVSRRHARLLRQNGHVIVEDLGSYNGIRVNGEKISGQFQVHDGDLIQIGDYDLAIQSDQQQAAPPPAPPAAKSSEHPANGVSAHANGADHVEPVTEADVQPISGENEADDDEPTAPTPLENDAAKRQSTAIIRVDQVEGSRPRQVVDIDPEEAPRLVVLNSELAGREFACIRSELRVGRADDNDISIDHRSLSRTHAKIVREANGEWRVIDLQSANGIAVNGESYAQCALRSGDTVTLGHVKLKFVGPGETFKYVPGQDYDKPQKPTGGKSSKTPLIVGGAVALVGVLAAVAYFGLGIGKPPAPLPEPKDEPTQVVIKPEPKHEEPKHEEPVQAKQDDTQAVDTDTTPDKKPDTEPEPQVANVDEKLAGAKAAIDAREFDKAADILGSIKNPDGSRPKKVEDLLDEVNAEILFKKNIAQAEKALAAGNLEEATRLSDESEGTLAYATELQKLKAKIQKAQDRQDKLAAKQAADEAKKNTPVEKVSDKEKKPSGGDEAKKLFDDGFAVLQSKQYNEAASIFRHCLELDPNFAKCHLYLGVSYAKLKQVDKGAYHYKMFVKLAPNDEQTPKVRKLLEQYEANKKGTP